METKIFKGNWEGNISLKGNYIATDWKGIPYSRRKWYRRNNIKVYPTKLYQKDRVYRHLGKKKEKKSNSLQEENKTVFRLLAAPLNSEGHMYSTLMGNKMWPKIIWTEQWTTLKPMQVPKILHPLSSLKSPKNSQTTNHGILGDTCRKTRDGLEANYLQHQG